MPIYRAKCRRCSHEFEDLVRIDDRHNMRCPKCGGETDLVLTPPRTSCFKPFWTRQFTGKPLYIESQKQLKAECDKRGLISHYTG